MQKWSTSSKRLLWSASDNSDDTSEYIIKLKKKVVEVHTCFYQNKSSINFVVCSMNEPGSMTTVLMLGIKPVG